MLARHKSYLMLLVVLTCACASENADRDAGKEHAQARLHSNKHPHPDVRLTSYSGSLCPPDSLSFSASAGGLTIVTSTEVSELQSCELHLEVTVPAGFRFRRPAFYASGWAASEEGEDMADNRVTMTYGLGDTQLTSEHTFRGATFSSGDSESFVLADTPQLTVPECEDPTQPTVLDLSIQIAVEVPEGNYLRVIALDGELELGVQWTSCSEGF
jgi:hypothetical protein